jgi:hypothetical protein
MPHRCSLQPLIAVQSHMHQTAIGFIPPAIRSLQPLIAATAVRSLQPLIAAKSHAPNSNGAIFYTGSISNPSFSLNEQQIKLHE